jgi:iron(III) transport system substrate-binding protein
VPDSAVLYPPTLKDPQGFFNGLYMNIYVPALNTNLVPRDQFPKTYADLLDPRFKGHMVWNPTNSTAAPLFVGEVLRNMGEEKGTAFLKALAAQRISRLQLSARSILDQVIAGDYAMGLMMSAAHVADSIRKGAPVDWVRLDPTPAAVIVVGILKNAPHPNAARLLVNFLTGPDGQKLIRDGSYIPALPTVQPLARELSPTEGGFNATFLNGMDIAPNLDSWTGMVADMFQ